MTDYPTKVTDRQKTAVNNLTFSLSASVAIDDEIIYVTSTTGAPTASSFHIENEVIFYTGKASDRFTGCTRGQDSTTAAVHEQVDGGNEVVFGPEAHHVNDLIEEVIATQTALGITGSFNFVAKTGAETVAGAKTFSDTPKMDAIAEKTAATGVTIDGILLKDDLATSGIQATLSSGQSDKTRHINLSAQGAITPATDGAALSQIDGTHKSYFVLDFDKATDEKAYWNFIVPDQYDGGSVTFNVWAITTVTSGTVVWMINTLDVADAATLDAALSTVVTFDAKTVDGTAGDAFVASKAADPGWTAGNLATVYLYRDTLEDDADADVRMLMVEIEWEVT